MQVLVQRVLEASCVIDTETTASIDAGFLLYVSFHKTDSPDLISKMAKKVTHLRIFEDEEGKMNRSLQDRETPAVLSISQFTLEADTRKGHRPSFTQALEPERAEMYFTRFNDALREAGVRVEDGRFGAHMRIVSVNDGPVTIRLTMASDGTD